MPDRKGEMMAMMKRWVVSNMGSSSCLLMASLFAAYARRGLPQMYFNLHIRRHTRRFLPFVDPFVTIDIISKLEHSIDRFKSSDAYAEVKAYLSAACSRDARELRAEGAVEGDGFVLSLSKGQEVADEFCGATVWWSSMPPSNQDRAELVRGHCIRLTFHQRHRELIVNEYLPHVRRSGREVLFSNRHRRLYTNKKNLDYISSRDEVWSYIDFDHPTTFDTLAMHPDKKQKIMDDLDDFCNNKDYYRRIGKAWKRGYLLYGPPGTGKSTMIAAMANYLNYDIYDIELTMVDSNNDLRKLFVETTGKSIIVIEDIDCSLDLTGQRRAKTSLPGQVDIMGGSKKRDNTSQVTLSGLLNFIDGLWSAHSGERIIIFTTNFLDNLDPALIRRGRMDMHIEMSYCCFEAFTTLAKNYLGVEVHPLFDTIKELLQVVEITPADVAECLMVSKCTDRGADACLGRLIDELKLKEAALKEKDKEKEEVAAAAAKPSGKVDIANGQRELGAGATRRLKKAADAKTFDLEAVAVDGGVAPGTEDGGLTGDLSDDDDSGDEDNLHFLLGFH